MTVSYPNLCYDGYDHIPIMKIMALAVISFFGG